MSQPRTDEKVNGAGSQSLRDMYFDITLLEISQVLWLVGAKFPSGVNLENITLADVYIAIASQTAQSPAEMDPSTHRMVLLRPFDRLEIETDNVLQTLLQRQVSAGQLVSHYVVLAQTSLEHFWIAHFTHLPRRTLWLSDSSTMSRSDDPRVPTIMTAMDEQVGRSLSTLARIGREPIATNFNGPSSIS